MHALRGIASIWRRVHIWMAVRHVDTESTRVDVETYPSGLAVPSHRRVLHIFLATHGTDARYENMAHPASASQGIIDFIDSGYIPLPAGMVMVPTRNGDRLLLRHQGMAQHWIDRRWDDGMARGYQVR
jgi:hypothetical protein